MKDTGKKSLQREAGIQPRTWRDEGKKSNWVPAICIQASCFSDPACSTPRGPAKDYPYSGCEVSMMFVRDVQSVSQLHLQSSKHPAKEEQNHTAHPWALSPLSCNTFSCCQLCHEGIEMVSLALVSYYTHLKQSKTHSRVIFPLILLSLAPMCSGFRKCQALSKLSSPRSSSRDALMCWHSPMGT